MADRTLMVKFQGKVDPSLDAAAKKTEAIAAGLGAAFGTLAARGIERAAEAAGDFLEGSLEQASKLTESTNVTTLVFGKQAEAMRGFFEDADQAIGMSEASAREASANIGGLLQNMGFANDESADWSQTLLKLAADMGSAFNKDPAQAIAAIGAGLRGESEPLKQFNVFLSDAAVKQKAFEMGLYSGKGAIDQNAKAQASLAIVMEQTSKVQGDFAATADEEANATRRVAAQTEDLQAKIGTQLLPVKKEMLRIVSEDIIPAFEGFTEGLQGTGEWIQKNTGWLLPLGAGLAIATAGVTAFGVAQNIVAAGGFVKWLTAALTSTQLYTAAQWMLNAALNANPIGLVVLALVALGAGLVIAWNKSETFRAVVTGAWNGIKDAAKGVTDWLTREAWPAVDRFVKRFGDGFDGLVKTLSAWGGKIKSAISGPIQWVGTNVLNPLLSGIEKVGKVFGLSLNLPRFASGGVVGGPAKMSAYATGGYTGPGSKWQPAGIVHAGEVVWSQEDVAAHGGVHAVDQLRQARVGYAAGGIVANARQGFRGYNQAFLSAIKAWAAATGRMWYMTGNGGARTFADQLRAWNLYQAGVGPLAANPYKGGPHMIPARAMDLSPRPGENPRARGLLGAFGLGLTVPGEPWHVGWTRGGGGGGGGAGGGGGFDPLAMLKDAIGSVAKVQGGGSLGTILNAVPPKLIAGAGDWLKDQLGFDEGGWLPPGSGSYHNGTGKPEAVFTAGQWDVLRQAVDRGTAVTVEGLREAFEQALAGQADLRGSLDGVELTITGFDPAMDRAFGRLALAMDRGV